MEKGRALTTELTEAEEWSKHVFSLIYKECLIDGYTNLKVKIYLSINCRFHFSMALKLALLNANISIKCKREPKLHANVTLPLS